MNDLSVTEAPHNTDFHTWMGKKHFCFFETAVTGNRTPNSGVKGSGANHYPRAPAQHIYVLMWSTCTASSAMFYVLRGWIWMNPRYWGHWRQTDLWCAVWASDVDPPVPPGNVHTMTVCCWASIADAGTALNRHCVNVSWSEKNMKSNLLLAFGFKVERSL